MRRFRHSIHGYLRTFPLVGEVKNSPHSHHSNHYCVMRQWDTRAAGQIAFAAAVWSSSLPVVVFAQCDSFTNDCYEYGFARRIMTIVIPIVVLLFFIAMLAFCLRRRRLRARTINLSRIPYAGMSNQPSIPPKPFSAPIPGYPVYYQATPPAPPPVHTPRYPPRGYDTYHSNLQSQPPSSNDRMMPEPVAPIPPVLLRAPSSVTPRPISSHDTTTPSVRSSARQNKPIAAVPRPPATPSSASLRSPQGNVVESPLPPLSPSSPLRSPSVVVPAAASYPQSNAARPFALSPMDTGASKSNIGEAPPAYTPI